MNLINAEKWKSGRGTKGHCYGPACAPLFCAFTCALLLFATLTLSYWDGNKRHFTIDETAAVLRGFTGLFCPSLCLPSPEIFQQGDLPCTGICFRYARAEASYL